jgi:hypothetical protein
MSFQWSRRIVRQLLFRLWKSTAARLLALAAACWCSAAVLSVLPAQADDSRIDLADWLDNRFRDLWAKKGVTPELCDDATFLKRISLDLIGRIPSVAEVREFESDPSPDKRDRMVSMLLGDPADSNRSRELHAEHLARIWRRIFLPPGSPGAAAGPAFEPWLEEQFRENVSYRELVRKLLTARGENTSREQIYYRAIGGTPESEATEFSRVLLGVRIGCAQCHDHPFASWKKADFWGMAAFFAGTQSANMQAIVNNSVVPGGQLNDDGATGSILHEGKVYAAKFLWESNPTLIDQQHRPRDLLADWMTSENHPTFAANAVNRVWQFLLGRGLVPAVDDLDLASPEDRVLLDDLGHEFADAEFDLRWLIAGICKSNAYQCSSETRVAEMYSVLEGIRPLKSMSPEQMFASLEQALMLPVSRSSADSARHNGEMDQLVLRLDEAIGRSPEEYTAGIPQTLILMNGPLLTRATDLEESHTLRAVVEAPFLSDQDRIETLYLATLTRRPRGEEVERLLNYLDRQPTAQARRNAYADILWALVNSPEFALCP